MEQTIQNKSKQDFQKLFFAYMSYFVFWINIMGILFLAVNYQLLFEYLNKISLVIISLITSIYFLLTGKKNFELASKDFVTNFSSFKVWIPNLIIFTIIFYLTIRIFFPSEQRVIIRIENEQDNYFAQPFPIKGSAAFYIIENDTAKIKKTEIVRNAKVEFNLTKFKDMKDGYIKLQLINTGDRFYIEPDSFFIVADFKNSKEYESKIILKKKSYKIILPPQIDSVKFEDITDFGKCSTQVINSGDIVDLVNGNYKYILLNEKGVDKYTDNIKINVLVLNDHINLPLNAKNVKIIVPKGILELNVHDYLGKIYIQNEKEVRLIENKNYEYVLSHKYYFDHKGLLSTNDMDSQGFIKIALSESNRKKAFIKFITELPDGEVVRSKIYINNDFKGNTDSTILLNFDKYNILLQYKDNISNKDEIFNYKCELNNFEINNSEVVKLWKLELE